MKQNIMQPFILIGLIVVGLFTNTNAQTVYLLKQNFDSIKATHTNDLPGGWIATINTAPISAGNSPGWFVDTLRGSNSAPMYYTGSGYGVIPDTCSGLDHLVIRNDVDSTGLYEFVSPTMNTVGKTAVNVSWGNLTSTKFTASGSTTPVLSFSIDGGSTWDTVAYSRATAGAWLLVNNGTPIGLPAKAANQASLNLKWSCGIVNNSKGTLRIDDIIVKATIGGGTIGINPIAENNSFNILPNPSTHKFTITSSENLVKNGKVIMTNSLGQTVESIDNCRFPITIERNDLQNGIYFVQISNPQNQLIVTKKLILE